MRIELQHLTQDSPYLLGAIRVYNEYIAGEIDYQEHFFRTHMRRPGYIGLIAILDERVVGVAFGSHSLVGQWWHERVASRVGYDHPALQNAWVLTQLNVLASYRNRKIGELLHNRIIEMQGCSNLLLSTQVANAKAQRFYLRHGWKVLHTGFRFSAGDEPYMILHKKLQASD